MAPFVEASKVQLMSSQDGVVPHGGYLLSLVVGACIKHQAPSHNPDPIHVTAHYLRATSAGPLEVHVCSIRTGRTLSNLSAELVQEGAVKILAHLVFGVLDPSSLPPPEIPLSLYPPAPHARLKPFVSHPSANPPKPVLPRFHFRPHIKAPLDAEVAPTTGGGVDVGEWHSWCDPADSHLTAPALAFFADVFSMLLPELYPGPFPTSWFPTVVMTLEFKAPIPRGARTLGTYMTCKFVNDSQGRHDVYDDLWTASEGADDGGDWRTAQRCLLLSHQTALALPMSVNEKKGKRHVNL